MSTKTAPPPLPVVTYNADRSTKYTQVYDAQSRSQPGQLWRVTYDERGGLWRCPCPATVADCAHIQAARWHQYEREWRPLWAVATDATLRAENRKLAARLVAGTATEWDRAGYSTLGEEINERMGRAA